MFKRNMGGTSPSSGATDPVQLQKAYWTFNQGEKDSLLRRFPDSLSWAELLRLQHLVSLEVVNQVVDGKRLLDAESHVAAADGPLHDLSSQITVKLLMPESPYRMRHCEIWQGQSQEQRPPDLGGQ